MHGETVKNLVFRIEEHRLVVFEDRALRRIVVSKGDEVRQESGGNLIMRSFMICKM